MGIGVSVFLLAVGAILTFALDVRVSRVDLDAVGWILMAAGGLGLIVAMIIWGTGAVRSSRVDRPSTAESRNVATLGRPTRTDQTGSNSAPGVRRRLVTCRWGAASRDPTAHPNQFVMSWAIARHI